MSGAVVGAERALGDDSHRALPPPSSQVQSPGWGEGLALGTEEEVGFQDRAPGREGARRLSEWARGRGGTPPPGGWICPWEPGEQGGMEQVVGEGTAHL